jgi:threonine dehydrogenase-like Zn-dependent dehydrogenase
MEGKVAALVAPQEVTIKEFDIPDPEPGAVLVRVRRANVCGSEIHIWHFKHPVIKQSVLGHEFVGEIVKLGAGVSTDYAGVPVTVGDRVVAPYYLTCRKCPACLRADFNLCQNAYAFWSQPPEVPPHFHGAFATHYYIHPNQYFYRVPDSVPDQAVAGANCGLSQVLFGLHKIGLAAGESLVIQGAGGLGLYAAAVAKEMGAQVIVIEGIPARLELAQRFGADEVVDLEEHSTVEQRVARVTSLTAGYGPDVVLEVTGVPAAFAEAVQLVRPGGRVVEIGNVNVGPDSETPFVPGFITRKAVRIQGLARYQPWFLHQALQFLQRRHTAHPFNRLTDREYALSEVAEAIRATEAKKVARPVVIPEAE